ncbi:MAG: C39 family peptidase [Ignavibacteriaceae bacterium]|nr:C39 family peptidase [Ignavibacteriaceae bacterium]
MKQLLLFLFILTSINLNAQIYPDQHFRMEIDSLSASIESSQGVKLSDDGKSFILEDGVLEGYIIFKPQSSAQPFNQGLPSWNGKSFSQTSSFKVQMRFPHASSWSPWLTVGYWKDNIWPAYGTTSYAGGKIDIDYVLLNSYRSQWQFQVLLKRTSIAAPSPSIHRLNFAISDSRTTQQVNITQIVADNPEAIFIPTNFIFQYSVDPTIGPDICSPTSVCMVLKSYNIEVNPLTFAQSTYDPYHSLFGVWPRVVQNASEYGLDGAVTRYRTWSEAREVLANGGRVVMSIGSPLYTGHLLMLAGFTADGKVIVHDPGKSAGYSLIYNKTDITRSWFSKGGISYTFYPEGDNPTSVDDVNQTNLVSDYKLNQNYPNPFNPSTVISFSVPVNEFVTLKVYDLLGSEVAVLLNTELPAGNHSVNFNPGDLASGTYIYRLTAGNFSETKKMFLIK